jgi:hypothetical protein
MRGSYGDSTSSALAFRDAAQWMAIWHTEITTAARDWSIIATPGSARR